MTERYPDGCWHGDRWVPLYLVVLVNPGIPLHWVLKASDGLLYLVPGHPGGWAHRTVYRGHVRGLERIEPWQSKLIVRTVGAGFDLRLPLDRRPWAVSEYEGWSPS